MQTKQHANRCPVYLHPAACTSPRAVAAIQRRTGLLVITNAKGRAEAIKAFASHPDANSTPFGGDAA